jgi:hypothetical protein
MRTRTALAASLVLVAGVGSLAPAFAGTKTVTKSYTASAFPPGGVASQATSTICSDAVPGSTFDATFKAPFKGRLTVDQTGFQGDWDLTLVQDGSNSAESAQDMTADPQTPEHIDGFKMKKGEEVTIRSCNFAGGPTASVKYSFK